MFRVSRLLTLAGFVDSYWFTPEGRDRGQLVHMMAEQVFTDHAVAVAPGFSGYELALRNAKAALHFTPIAVERRLNAFGISGRPDLIGWIDRKMSSDIHAGPVIIDIKSGGQYPSHGIQLAYYARLAEATPDLRQALPTEIRALPWQRLGLYVRETGRYKLHPYTDMRDRFVADAILDVVMFRYDHGMLAADAAIQADDPSVPEEAMS